MLAVFSVLLEESDEKKIMDICLDGFHDSIRVTSILGMNTERDAFVSTLAKFTSLALLSK